MNRTDKRAEIQDLKEKFLRSSGVIVTEYRGLSVSAIQNVRNEFRKEQAEFRVVKNTLAKRALKDSPLESIADSFEGPVAIAISFGDPVAAAKVAVKYAKENNKLVLKKGYTDGQVFDDIEAMSTMPSKEEIRAQFVGTLLAAPQKFLQVLHAAPQTFLYLLKAREEQLKEQGEAK
jgi:large subunit ribosomal protein L10